MRRAHNQAGVSMIEVLAAMLILSIGILALAPMMVLSISANEFSNDVTSVAAAAQRSAENMIGRGSFPSMPYVDTTRTDDGVYKVETVVSDNTVDNSIPDKVYQIVVAITWVDETGLNRNLAFETYTTKP